MFSYICICTALTLAVFSTKNYRIISYIIFAEFLAHELIYLAGVPEPILYALYAAINVSAIFLITRLKSHFAISALLLINLCYNVLTISQYSFPIYDFYGLYGDFVGAIMILEILYMVWITEYVSNKCRNLGIDSVSGVGKFFTYCHRFNNWSLF